MDISVIIVNYNVRHFLEQCLVSVYQAIADIPHEIIVVDNNSTDGSAGMIKKKFPSVKLIVNEKNIGFGAANNKALEIAQGNYLLLLNPDTVIHESTINRCIEFMNNNAEAGAVGVKMIDGKGKYLPESKRAVPTPATAFYRILNLNKLFPRSGKYNRYYLGNLSEDKIQEIEILTGAFFFTRKEILDDIGFFDEEFFMYGEDIDLSYRIIKAGYKIYYLPEPSIIHYKGESTSKGTLNYVIHFYKAMMIFNRKHFAQKKIRPISWLINIAIIFRASMSYLRTILRSLLLPLIEFGINYPLYGFIAGIWAEYIIVQNSHYPPVLRYLILPAYLIIWILAIAFFRGYRQPLQFKQAIKGIISGTILILVIYALLPESLRFSRALIIIGALLTFITTGLVRIIAGLTGLLNVRGISSKERKTLIISEREEYEKICKIINDCNLPSKIIGRVYPSAENIDIDSLANLRNINETIRINNIDELIFSSSDLSAGKIIETIEKLSGKHVIIKIARTDSDYLIGSNSRLLPGEIYSFSLKKLI